MTLPYRGRELLVRIALYYRVVACALRWDVTWAAATIKSSVATAWGGKVSFTTLCATAASEPAAEACFRLIAT